MTHKFRQSVHTLASQKSKILLAVSGGMDSVCMVYLCRAIGINFGIAHCNFHLRAKESDEDETFVRNLAQTLGVPCHVAQIDTSKIKAKQGGNTQLIARETRYDFFEKVRVQHSYDYIATAHHINDSLETTLYNLSKGTGIRGLAGIPRQNGYIIRPMQVFTRSEIENYISAHSISYREDSSNSEDKYARNKLRHHVVPVLQELNPALEISFEKTQNNIHECVVLLDFLLQKIQADISIQDGDIFKIHKEKLLSYPATRTILHELLSPYQFNNTQIDNILEMIHHSSGKQVFSDTHRVVNDRTFLLIQKRNGFSTTEITIPREGTYMIDDKKWSFEIVEYPVDMNVDFSQVHYLDAEHLHFPLFARRKQAGDVFHPFGMKGKKTVKKYFSDEKFSLFDKEKAWIITTQNTICAILGHRIDERFRIGQQTKRVLKITKFH